MFRWSSASSPGVSRIAVFPRTAACVEMARKPARPIPALADVPVPVFVSAELDLGIVEVEHHDAIVADLAFDQIEEPVDARR